MNVPIIKTNVKIYTVNDKLKKLVHEGHNTTCQPGLFTMLKAVAGNKEYAITHIASMWEAGGAVGPPPALDKYSNYDDFEAAAVGYSIEEVEIRNYSFTTYNPLAIDVYDNNILGVQSTFTEPNTAVGGDYLRACALLNILPGGEKNMFAVYVPAPALNKPAGDHFSIAWSIALLVPVP